MDFPINVYHSPGNHPAPGGKSFALLSIADQPTYDAALEAGWFATVPESIENSGKPLKDIVIKEVKPKAEKPKAE
jgi:hypothetical protein